MSTRPGAKYPHSINWQTTAAQGEAIDYVCQASGLSRAEILRQCVEASLKNVARDNGVRRIPADSGTLRRSTP